ncbi:u3 small nucleolar rna-associated protein 14 [Holotrichia oblita]|uniref:U3 small nucleolar rna-associated protein 14 n=1 Tax=Holotrichia oblita TaxID=644536 RepID=A0ACB9SN29_HOLOL|nr:u3 small nucleolar rna-associated protein 14 [Holotrichia oblita]
MEAESDSDIGNNEHKRLVDNVLNLNSRQHVKKPTRTEPTAQISEYNLIKSLSDNKDAVRIHDLTKSLETKPLEKPQADRIRRSTAYESTKTQLNRWEPVVTSNRVSTNLSFPLKNPNFKYKEGRDFMSNWVLKSNLQKELEKLEPKVEVIEVETESAPKLTLKEMMEKRKELAKLQRYQNYKEIKARWQNKIKSKKFRRIQRKEKIKEQMKEFELLQKTNPEEALKKLEEIEKARAEERASLRHKSTGKWARNQQIRAKYDKESRKVLAEQLAVSKELTQKQQVDESDESDDESSSDEKRINFLDGDNPWTNKIKVTKEVEDFVTDYNKFRAEETVKTPNNTSTQNGINTTENEDIAIKTKERSEPCLTKEIEKETTDAAIKQKKRKLEKSKPEKENAKICTKKRKVKKENILHIDSASSIWEVTSLDYDNDNVVDDIFDNIEYKLKNAVNKRIEKVKTKLESSKKVSNKELKQQNVDNKPEVTVIQTDTQLGNKYKATTTNSEIPEQMKDIENIDTNKDLNTLKSVLLSKPRKDNKLKSGANIPEKVINSKPVSLNSSIPDVLTYDDNEETIDRTGIIAEAFEDADIMEEFAQDKKDEVEKDRPKNIDLTLPGWGSWGGKNIPISKKKKKRFILKGPKQFSRKDINKGNLIINESGNDKIKSHLVNEVPFPFKTVKDFEASVRAPVGNTFIPETAYRKMIKPSLKTKMGAIIEPITEDILLHREKRYKKEAR